VGIGFYSAYIAPAIDIQFAAMRPISHQIIGDLVVIVWEDGHESYYPLEYLRRRCPCAHCAGEPDLFGRMSRPTPQALTDRSFEIHALQMVGNYALQPHWADGHVWGIWTFERLREACPCEECRAGEGSRMGE
jgi:DUF971 family protein